jgi:hypothetical protein
MSHQPLLSINQQIHNIFETNKLDDLKRFISKRQCLNSWNIHLIYLFHTIQSAGILTTTIGTGYGYNYLIWIGVGLNVMASLIHIFEKTNNTISDKMLKNIILIKNNKYIDESTLVDLDTDSKSITATTTTTNSNSNTTTNSNSNTNSNIDFISTTNNSNPTQNFLNVNYNPLTDSQLNSQSNA